MYGPLSDRERQIFTNSWKIQLTLTSKQLTKLEKELNELHDSFVKLTKILTRNAKGKIDISNFLNTNDIESFNKYKEKGI